MDPEVLVLEYLKNNNIDFDLHRHPPVNTVAEAEAHWKDIKGMHCKNLFFRNNKGKRHYLLVLESHKIVDIKAINSILNERLSFASAERLQKYLGLKPGSVSAFGLINDSEKEVNLILDQDIKEADYINFHPNINTSTLTISGADFFRFLEIEKRDYSFISF